MSTGIRQPWLESTISKLQMAAARALLERPDDACHSLKKLAEDLPDTQTIAEAVLLRGLLVEFASRWTVHVHRRAHHGRPADCEFPSSHFLERLASFEAPQWRVAFRDWVRVFVPEFSRIHPVSVAVRAAIIIRHEFDKSFTVESLAVRLRTTPNRLRAEFLNDFGSSIPDYRNTVRIIESMRQVATDKIDAVATTVGYKSKKNFYRAFRKLTGLTPTAFRSLSPEAASALIDAAWARVAPNAKAP